MFPLRIIDSRNTLGVGRMFPVDEESLSIASADPMHGSRSFACKLIDCLEKDTTSEGVGIVKSVMQNMY